ncbi:MAG: hypothetical protein LRY72_05335 [Saccharospirillaceae bacterium]|nr:hypothetical protein [Saccharospirillaceae bacterium]
MRNRMQPFYLALMALCAGSLNAEPLAQDNWQERMAIGLGVGSTFSIAGLRLDIPLTDNMDLLPVIGHGGALGLQHRPLESYPRFGYGAMYGSVATINRYEEYGMVTEEACPGASLFAGITPRYDRFSVSAGIGYLVTSPRGACTGNAERTDGDPHWQASLGLHLPLRIRGLGRLHRW